MRIQSFDTFKAIAALMIVSMHCRFPGDDFWNALCRVAVPYFFMVSGYFVYHKENSNLLKRCEKNMKKLLVMNLTLIVVFGIYYIWTKGGDAKAVRSLWRLLTMKEFLLYNFKFQGHLWFIRALLYLYVVLWIWKKLLKDKADLLLGIICWLMLIGNLVISKYSFLFSGIHVSPDQFEIPNKFLGTAIVAFFMGYYIKKYQSTIMAFVERKKVVLALLAASFVLFWMEYMALNTYFVDLPKCNYISTYTICLMIFLTAMAFPELKMGFLNVIGNKYSLWIYILHISLRKYIEREDFAFLTASETYQGILRIFIIYICCVLLSILFLGAKSFLQNRKA